MAGRRHLPVGVLDPGTGAEDDYACFVPRQAPDASIHIVCPEHHDNHQGAAVTSIVANLARHAFEHADDIREIRREIHGKA